MALGGAASRGMLDLIAVFDGRAFVDVLRPRDRREALQKTANRSYFPIGAMFSVFDGGEAVGSATVRRFVEGYGERPCPEVLLKTKARLADRLYLVADGPPGHVSHRRAAAAAERKVLRDAAAARLRRAARAKGRASGKISLAQAVATVLDGRPVLIGVATLDGDRGSILLVIDLAGEVLLESTRIAPPEPPTGYDDKASQHESYLDQLDLDGDGRDELVTVRHLYESWSYTIYSSASGRFEHVFDGGGGAGCW